MYFSVIFFIRIAHFIQYKKKVFIKKIIVSPTLFRHFPSIFFMINDLEND